MTTLRFTVLLLTTWITGLFPTIVAGQAAANHETAATHGFTKEDFRQSLPVIKSITWQEVFEVTGRVVDVDGIPLIGATIQESGGTTGTVTDYDGNFQISVCAPPCYAQRLGEDTRF